jgi:hypothetical protein
MLVLEENPQIGEYENEKQMMSLKAVFSLKRENKP